MTTPREPREPRDPYDVAHEPDGTAWGRPPAGGWGADRDRDDPGRGDPGYGGYGYAEHEDGEYGRGGYGDADDGRGGYEPGGYGRGGPDPYGDEPRYGRPEPRYEPAGGYGAGPPPPTGPRAASGHERHPPSWGPGYALTTPRRPARRRRPPWVALAAAAAAVAALLVLGFVAPGWFVTRVFSAPAVQTGVAKILTDDYGAEGVADVRCPEGVEVAAGATFTCDATIDGDPVTVPVRVTDGDGGYEVGRPT